jgi:hypothetical protein
LDEIAPLVFKEYSDKFCDGLTNDEAAGNTKMLLIVNTGCSKDYVLLFIKT